MRIRCLLTMLNTLIRPFTLVLTKVNFSLPSDSEDIHTEDHSNSNCWFDFLWHHNFCETSLGSVFVQRQGWIIWYCLPRGTVCASRSAILVFFIVDPLTGYWNLLSSGSSFRPCWYSCWFSPPYPLRGIQCAPSSKPVSVWSQNCWLRLVNLEYTCPNTSLTDFGVLHRTYGRRHSRHPIR